MSETNRPNNGYNRLKAKYAALEQERDHLQKDLDIANRVANDYKNERDQWEAKYAQADAAKQDAVDRFNRKQRDYEDVMQSFKIEAQNATYLLNHCPFWVRWIIARCLSNDANNR